MKVIVFGIGHRFWDLRRTRNMMMLDGWTKHGIEAIAINPDGTDMDLNVAREKTNNYELRTEDFRYVIHQVPYTEAAEREFVIEESFYFFPSISSQSRRVTSIKIPIWNRIIIGVERLILPWNKKDFSLYLIDAGNLIQVPRLKFVESILNYIIR